MTRIQVMPREIQPGDKIDRLEPETMEFTSVTIASVETATPNSYRIHCEGDVKPFYVNSRRTLTVERG